MNFVRLIAATTVAVFLASNAGAADLIQTYDFSGTLSKAIASNDQVTGSFTLDLSKSAIEAFDFSTPFGTFAGNGGLWINLHPVGASDTVADLSFTSLSSSLSSINLLFAEPFVDGELLSDTVKISKRPPIFVTADAGCVSFVRACGGKDLFAANFTSGALTLAAPAPEPATWVMFIAGLFGLGATLRASSRRPRQTGSIA